MMKIFCVIKQILSDTTEFVVIFLVLGAFIGAIASAGMVFKYLPFWVGVSLNLGPWAGLFAAVYPLLVLFVILGWVAVKSFVEYVRKVWSEC